MGGSIWQGGGIGWWVEGQWYMAWWRNRIKGGEGGHRIEILQLLRRLIKIIKLKNILVVGKNNICNEFCTVLYLKQ